MLKYFLFCEQLSSESEDIKTVTMRFFQLLLKVANHAALLAPTVKQTEDQQEKVSYINVLKAQTYAAILHVTLSATCLDHTLSTGDPRIRL